MKMMIVLLLTLFSAVSIAKEPAPFTPEQEKQIEALIQEALFNDPNSPADRREAGETDPDKLHRLQLPILQAVGSNAGKNCAEIS